MHAAVRTRNLPQRGLKVERTGSVSCPVAALGADLRVRRLPSTVTVCLFSQYMNRSSERFLGYTMQDVAGKCLLETNSVDNKELMVQQLQRGREWEGVMSWRRKTGDSVVLSGRVIPVSATGR